MLEPANVGDMIYHREQINQLRDQLIEYRDGALDHGAMSIAVTLTHTIGLLYHLAKNTEIGG